MKPDKITAIRDALGLSQAAFARKLGVKGSTVWRWETGRCAPRLAAQDEIRKLSKPAAPAMPVTTATVTIPAAPAAEAIEERTMPNETEAALLHATAQITAAWLAQRKIPVEAGVVTDFVQNLTRALRRA
jgi:transcriptional regulator with XRE-family HTH domain